MHKNPFSGKRSTEPFRKDYCHFYAYAFCGKMASLGNTVNSIELTPSPKRCVPASLRGRVSTLRMLLPTHFPKNPSSPKGWVDLFPEEGFLCISPLKAETWDHSFIVMQFDFDLILTLFYTRNWVKNESKSNRITPKESSLGGLRSGLLGIIIF